MEKLIFPIFLSIKPLIFVSAKSLTCFSLIYKIKLFAKERFLLFNNSKLLKYFCFIGKALLKIQSSNKEIISSMQWNLTLKISMLSFN